MCILDLIARPTAAPHHQITALLEGDTAQVVQISLDRSSRRDGIGQSIQRQTTCPRRKITKKQGLGLVLLNAWDKLCFGDATILFISAAYLFDKQTFKEIWGRWYPLCSRKWL